MKKFSDLTQFERDCIIDKFSAEAIIKALKGDNDEIRKCSVYLDMKGELSDKPMIPEPIELMHMRLLRIASGDVVFMNKIRNSAVLRAERTVYIEENDEVLKLPEVMVCVSR
jgi:hypothetical protein